MSPAIIYICEYFDLSESLAGVTFIAFVNGAGDIFTAIAASDSKEGISYNLGSLYGAGLFVLTFVVSMVIFVSPNELTMPKTFVFRDLMIYLLGTFSILGMAWQSYINFYDSISLIGFYGFLVIAVII